MKIILKLENIALFILSIVIFSSTSVAWWWFLVLLFTPDIGMFGYAINSRIGAYVYNFFHHKGIAVLFILLGWFYNKDIYFVIGSVLLAHSSLDRVFGYGLKFISGFKHTHLGDLK